MFFRLILKEKHFDFWIISGIQQSELALNFSKNGVYRKEWCALEIYILILGHYWTLNTSH
jgi:hypothetical protein